MCKKFNLWEKLSQYRHNIDFNSLEKRILMFESMKQQGILTEKVTKALNEKNYSISATFKSSFKNHTLVLQGINVTEIKNVELNLIEIEVSDIIVDGISIL